MDQIDWAIADFVSITCSPSVRYPVQPAFPRYVYRGIRTGIRFRGKFPGNQVDEMSGRYCNVVLKATVNNFTVSAIDVL